MKDHEQMPTIASNQEEIRRALSDLERVNREGRLAPELAPLLAIAPPGPLEPRVSLRHVANDRQIKSSASAVHFDPASCGVWIEYRPKSGAKEVGGSRSESERDNGLAELVIQALDRASLDSKLRFVAWSWFRDKYLPAQGVRGSSHELQAVLVGLVSEEQILTDKIPNPREPAHPTTTLKLNRSHAEVQRALGSLAGRGRFDPVELPGRPVSETILLERR